MSQVHEIINGNKHTVPSLLQKMFLPVKEQNGKETQNAQVAEPRLTKVVGNSRLSLCIRARVSWKTYKELLPQLLIQELARSV